MLPLATEQNRRLLTQSQQANQQIAETVEQMRAQIQQTQLPFYARRNRRQLAHALDRIAQQIEQQQQSQQQIELLLTPSPCTASTLIFHHMEESVMQPTPASTVATHASNKPREWSLIRDVSTDKLPLRVIGQS